MPDYVSPWASLKRMKYMTPCFGDYLIIREAISESREHPEYRNLTWGLSLSAIGVKYTALAGFAVASGLIK